MKSLKGAQAPFSRSSQSVQTDCIPAAFVSPVHVPQLRDDALLKLALDYFQAGSMADALLAVEYVCRRHPNQVVPHLLRARIVEACCPELLGNAWYQAFCCDPENPQFQDSLLQTWLNAKEIAAVQKLGLQLLALRCQQGNEQNLLKILATTGMTRVGACWRNGECIEGKVFQFASESPLPIDGAMRAEMLDVLISNGQQDYACQVPSDGSLFSLDQPDASPLWTLAFSENNHESGASPAQILQGSPIAFAPTVPARANSAGRRTSITRRKKLPDIHILIPVYAGFEQVKICINSVLKSLPLNNVRARLLVIDDASPEPALSAWLDELAARNEIDLLRNPYNLGYLESMNQALLIMPNRPKTDILFLNADTQVHGNWLDRLQAGLYAANDIASVTPWSNNGEISSFPKIAVAEPNPSAAQLAALDEIAASLPAEGIDLPSCCGFCMLMRGDVLALVGGLDGFNLQRGYGEEVDWCLRASQMGFRHQLLNNVFVAHAGGISFGSEKKLRVKQNKRILQQHYPNYYRQYREFVRLDPLSLARQAFLQEIVGNVAKTSATAKAKKNSANEQALFGEARKWLELAQRHTDVEFERSNGAVRALPSTHCRVAILQYNFNAEQSQFVLQLARYIAARGFHLRLIVIGYVNEAMWHTGVVDGLPNEGEKSLCTNLDFLALLDCQLILRFDEQILPTDIAQKEISVDCKVETCVNQLLDGVNAVLQKHANKDASDFSHISLNHATNNETAIS